MREMERKKSKEQERTMNTLAERNEEEKEEKEKGPVLVPPESMSYEKIL